MQETKIYYDGTAIHYFRRSEVHQNSLLQLEKRRERVKQSEALVCPINNPIEGKQTNTRFFSIKSKHKRQLRAACVFIHSTKPKGLYSHFVTVTFSGDVPNEEGVRQRMFKRFCKNISAYREVLEYVGVKERGEKNGLIHYHLLITAPFVPYKKLNHDFVQIHKNFGFSGSNNCITTSSGRRSAIVKDAKSVARYISKYITKGDKHASPFVLPCVFYSKGARPKAIVTQNKELLTELADTYAASWRYISDNFAVTKHNRAIYDAANHGVIN